MATRRGLTCSHPRGRRHRRGAWMSTRRTRTAGSRPWMETTSSLWRRRWLVAARSQGGGLQPSPGTRTTAAMTRKRAWNVARRRKPSTMRRLELAGWFMETILVAQQVGEVEVWLHRGHGRPQALVAHHPTCSRRLPSLETMAKTQAS